MIALQQPGSEVIRTAQASRTALLSLPANLRVQWAVTGQITETSTHTERPNTDGDSHVSYGNMGRRGGSALPSAQGVTPGSRDRVPCRAPCMEPASLSASLCVSHK